MSVIIFIIILAVLILVHEFGHFIVAKKAGIRVDEFGLGLPPKAISKRWGETLYTLNWLPFGGFVKIFGEDPHVEEIKEEDKARSFYYKPKWIQASVLAAGVTFNIIFAWLLVSLGFMIGFPSVQGNTVFGKVQNPQLVITEVLPNSPANTAGLKQGDVILFATSGDNSLQGEALVSDNIQHLIADSKSNKVDILYKRGSTAPVTTSIVSSGEIVAGKKAIGIATETVGLLKLPIHLALLEGVHSTLNLIKGTVVGLLRFLWGIVTFTSDLSQVSGPIGIASIVGQARNLGFVFLLSLTALISINLAVINLLPFPALDGGRLFFILIEVIIRRPIKPSIVRWTNTVGFFLLITLMVVITVHDIFKLF
jgi:regulator of sigma E protease